MGCGSTGVETARGSSGYEMKGMPVWTAFLLCWMTRRGLRPGVSQHGRRRLFRCEVAVYRGRSLTSFRNCPYDERLTTPHIAGGKDAIYRGHVVGVGGDVATLVDRDAELFDHSTFDGTEEAHRKKYKINIERELRSDEGFELRRRADAEGVKLFDVAVLVPGELDAVDAPVANSAFFVRALDAQLQRPERPWG